MNFYAVLLCAIKTVNTISPYR